MIRALRCVVVAVGILSASGCGITAPTSVEAVVTGSWTGRATGVETADFTLALVQTGSNITGSGSVVLQASGNRHDFDVAGSKSAAAVTVILKFRTGRADVQLTGPVVLWGAGIDARLNGGNIQNDGPFPNTPLMLSRQ